MRKLLASLAILGGLAVSSVAPAMAQGYYYHHHHHHYYYRHHHRGHMTVIYHR